MSDRDYLDMLDHYSGYGNAQELRDSFFIPSPQETITVSRHVWLVEKFAPSTVDDAIKLVEFAVKSGLTAWDDVARLVGYVCESIRQAGSGKSRIHRVMSEPKNPPPNSRVLGPFHEHRTGRQYWDVWITETMANRVAAAIRSNHRYAKGKNKDNYLKGGVKLLAAAAPRFGLVETADTMVIIDKMIDVMTENPERYERLADSREGITRLRT